MFDNEDNDFDSIDNLLWKYQALKNGNTIGNYLDTEEFEQVLEYFLSNYKMKEALECLDLALSIHNEATNLLFFKAEMLFDVQNFGQALKALDTIDELNPTLVSAIILRSDILVDMNKHDEAIAFIQSKLNIVSDYDRLDILMTLADIYDDLTDFAKVYETLEEVLSIDPNFQEALHKIAFWADLANKNLESINFHQKLLDNNPFNAVAWYNLASAYHSNKDYNAAIEAYQYCIDLDERVEAAYRNLADAYMRIKKFDEAIEALEKILEIAKAEDVIYEAMGQCFEKKKDFNKARYFYRQAIKLSPEDDLFFFKIGETYHREKNYDKAYESYLSAYRLNEDNHQYPYAIANCLLELDREKEAIVYYLKSLTLKPATKNTWIGMGKALFALGLYEELLMHMEMAEEHCGQKAEFEYLQVAALFELGKSKEAINQLHQAMSIAPTKFKLLQELIPEILTRKSVADVWMNYKKK